MKRFNYDNIVLNDEVIKSFNASTDELREAANFLFVCIFDHYQLKKPDQRFNSLDLEFGNNIVNVRGADEYVSCFTALSQYLENIN
ncbi:hypothetical protein [Apilactobacillus kunkeei]|uniref:hypothetical protein n=1 Tax=Apilactobacillus kunkeei TaxID=148814 RepID=UPI00070FE749|nr:hypothetical protein [Apilactobacillus kunkeei]